MWQIRELFKYYIKKIFYPYHRISYSQEGEDLLLDYIFKGKNDGFYIDIGAHHPKRFSNTYLFYKKGWRGINIDATPGSMRLFRKYRFKDINLEYAISDKSEQLTFYLFNEPALNTFNKKYADKYLKKPHYKIIAKKLIKTQTVNSVLAKYPPPKTIDFMSIDVEGYDEKVIKSLNLSKYKPKIILIESADNNIENVLNSKINKFLHKYHYSFYLKTFNTLFYKLDEF